MKSLLFALGLALCCFVQAEWKDVTRTTSSKEYLGRWITIGIACNSSEAVEQIKYLSAFAADVSTPEENVFSISAHIPMPDGCKNITRQLRKGEDGNYYSLSDDTVVKVESVKVLGEFVLSTINDGKEFRATAFHGRKVTQDPVILQKFKEECKKLGYSEDQIVVLDPTVKCQ